MEKAIITSERVESLIIVVRGQKVMLDRDLAQLYRVETRILKQAVKRNINRFPEDFMFELTKEEEKALRSQNVILKRGQHSKYLPYAFTEQGVAMLSSVLNSERAIDVNIEIMRAFVRLRKMSISQEWIAQKFREIETRLEDHDESIKAIIEAIEQLAAPEEKPKKQIGFEVKEARSRYGKRGGAGSQKG